MAWAGRPQGRASGAPHPGASGTGEESLDGIILGLSPGSLPAWSLP